MANIIMADKKSGKIPARSAWYRPPDWPDYSQLDTSEFETKPGYSTYDVCCFFTVWTKHPTIRSIQVNGLAYLLREASIGHLDGSSYIVDKDFTSQQRYSFADDDPEYVVMKIRGAGSGNYSIDLRGCLILEAYGYFDFSEFFNRGNAFIDSPSLEAMTLWGDMKLGGLSTPIYLNNLKYIDLSHASSMVISGRFYAFTAFSGFRNLTVCKLPAGIRNTSNEKWQPYAMFQNCASLGEINLKNMEYAGVTTFKDNFNGCSSLVSINLDGVDMSSVTSMSGAFTKCSVLENISLVGTRLPGVAMSFSDSPLLTVETLNAIIAALPAVESAVTLTIGATNKAKLTEEEIAVATEKGWTVA